jgi:hypothetical protein
MDLSILHPHIKIDHPYLFLGCLFISLISNLGGFAPPPPPPPPPPRIKFVRNPN